ncbi:hypothetical protein IWX50DRAFT_408247 [Phyllosticta citricarpa]
MYLFFGPPVVFFRLRATGLLVFNNHTYGLPCFEPVPFQKLQNGAAISSCTCQRLPALCMCMYAELQTAPLRLAASPAPSSWASQTELEKENDDRLKVVLMATVDIGLSGAPCIASKVARLGRCRCRRRRRRRCSQLSKDLASCAPTREDCPRVKPDASRRPDSRVCIHPPLFLRDSLQSRPSVGAFGLFCSALLCSALLCSALRPHNVTLPFQPGR